VRVKSRQSPGARHGFSASSSTPNATMTANTGTQQPVRARPNGFRVKVELKG
jgi:hypothetical protein